MNQRTIPNLISMTFWALAVALVIILTWRLYDESGTFWGIAEPSETNVSLDASADVVELKVLPGQRVHAGDILVRLRRPDLDMRMSELSRSLQGNVGETVASESETHRRIAESQAAFQTRTLEIRAEIQRLTEERSRNLTLVKAIQGDKAVPSEGEDQLLMRIRSLQHQLEAEGQSQRNLVELLRKSQGSQNVSTGSERAMMQKELGMLRQEAMKLCIRAQNDGVIGSVNYHVGEKVAPFAPIVTVSSSAPAVVRGYIQENVYSGIAIGDSLWVRSSGQRAVTVRGVVVGMGSRIIQLPDRLWKAPTLPLWGRELTVRIPVHNPFLLGEMVSLERHAGLGGF